MVIIAVGVLSAWLFAPVRRVQTAEDVVAAGLYVINRVLHAEAVDYFHEGLAVSPVQHYWSLSVEEKFYLVWPVLLMAAWRYGPRRGADPGSHGR